MRIIPFSTQSNTGDQYVRLPFPKEGLSVSCAISLRTAGEMTYNPDRSNSNRTRFFFETGLNPLQVAARIQTHSRDVCVVGADDFRRLPPGDGMATIDPTLILSVTVADCLPIFLSDTETGAIALLHSGWKGTGIVGNALSLMRECWGTSPSRVSAVLGPCIRSCCYEVDAERAAVFEKEFGSIGSGMPLGPVVRRAGPHSYIDMQAANVALMEAAGIRDVAVCQDCTFTDERFGSFRREGSEHFTRMVALLGRLPEEKNR